MTQLVQFVRRTPGIEDRPRALALISDSVRAGVVMIHQFWGHKYASGMMTSRKYPGVNVNELHDDRVRDRFTGMPVFNGTPCRVSAMTTG